MSYAYDRLALVQAIGETLSAFFFADMGAGVTAAELRARAEAMGVALGRIQAVLAEEGAVGADTLMEVRRLEQLHSRALTEDGRAAMRPGGAAWNAIQRE